jgi:F-type H+-transporting ATPase subunit gamma
LLPIEIVSRDADTDVTDTGGSSVLAAAAGQVSGTTSEGPSDDEKLHALYEFIPNARAVLDLLLPYYVECRVYDFMSQSFASEMAARQNAMHTATDNATDLIKKYTLLANKARQEQITSEIIEIVSGADALS